MRLDDIMPATVPDQPKLQHVIEAIYDATMKAQANVQLNNLNNLLWLFPENEEGVHEPRCVTMKVPSPNGQSEVITVPLFILVNHKQLTIHEMKLKTSVDVELFGPPERNASGVRSLHHRQYDLKLVPGKKQTDIEITMKIDDPVEAVNRVMHKYEVHL